MKKKFLNILAVSAILTTIGFLMDSDLKEPSMFMRFAEFFGMMGFIFLLSTTLYFSAQYMLKGVQRIKS